jgi:hypothetical protein
MDQSLKDRVLVRAGNCCEYCQLPQAYCAITHEVEHVLPEKHLGPTEFDNLALACRRCNRCKGPNLTGIDPESGNVAMLFSPRRDRWSEHFRWTGAVLTGLTAIGRATIQVLCINDPMRVSLRESLIAEGVFPPQEYR